jgi:predicted permease
VAAAAGVVSATTFVIEGDDGRTQQVATRLVTDGFFELVGAPMMLGRATTAAPSEGSFGSAVISFPVWDRMFGRDSAVVGRTIRFTAGPATVVAVAPPEFDLPRRTDVWLMSAPGSLSETRMYEGYLRLRASSDRDLLREELASLAAGLVAQRPDRESERTFIATPLIETLIGNFGAILLIVLGAAAVLLILGCVNVATLVIAREGEQTREMAIRKALGANHRQIIGELLTESVLLSVAGTGLGLLLAFASVQSLSAIDAPGLPRLDQVTFDLRVVAFAVVALVATAILIGTLPIARLATTDVRSLLGSGSRSGGTRSQHLLSGIVIAEITIAVALVASAGWLVRSYGTLVDIDPGFSSEGRLVFQSALLGSSYLPVQSIVHGSDGPTMIPDRTGGTPRMWLQELGGRLDGIGDVSAVGVGSALPFGLDPDAMVPIAITGEPRRAGAEGVSRLRSASPDFFAALGVPLIAGRFLAEDEPRESVIVNEAFVRAYLRDEENPLAKSFAWGSPEVDFDNVQTIVGVVADVRYRSIAEPPEPTFYTLGYPSRGTVVVSTSRSDAAPLIPLVQGAVQAVDARIPVTILPLETIVSGEFIRYRVGLLFMALFAAVSLVLAGIGIHGVVSHTMVVRSSEFAVRIALGAHPARIATSVLRLGAVLWLVGTVAGVGAAYVAGRLVESQLYYVEAWDLRALSTAIVSVAALTLAAFSISAVRIARVGPAEALRST